MELQTPDKTEAIAKLNDLFRKTFVGGLIVTTSSVAAMDRAEQSELLKAVQTFNDFSEDNDPHGEHDFGSLKIRDGTFFWKIDYYDRSMEMGSPDPSNTYVTKRVLTVMRASEY